MLSMKREKDRNEKELAPGFEHQIEPQDLLSGCFLALVLIIATIVALIFGGWY